MLLESIKDAKSPTSESSVSALLAPPLSELPQWPSLPSSRAFFLFHSALVILHDAYLDHGSSMPFFFLTQFLSSDIGQSCSGFLMGFTGKPLPGSKSPETL